MSAINRKVELEIRTGLRDCEGFVCIDSIIGGTSSGGMRIAPDLPAEEVRQLAREMTLKFSFIGLHRGGAKSGVRIREGLPQAERLSILEELGRRLAPVIADGLYYPGMDMNCGPVELTAVYRGAGLDISSFTDSSYYTAMSVANAITATLSIRKAGNRPVRIAVEGFGSVGKYLAERLPEEIFRFVAVSTARGAVVRGSGFGKSELLSARQAGGDAFVESIPGDRLALRDLFAVEADVLVPAARTRVIDADRARTVRAGVIVPSANAPYTEEAVLILHGRGILALPGFVANCGGVFGSTLHDSGVDDPAIERLSESLYRKVVERLLRRSLDLGVSPMHFAEKIAEERFRKVVASSGPGPLAMLKKFRRRGLVPKRHFASRVLSSFGENLVRLAEEIERSGCS
ncbi:MAG: Glu/Leu/Phe/Val dehydrogenase dimerization domain-containing protein [Syntrophales bacterium]